MQILTGHTKRVNDISFSPDGTLLLSSANDETVRVWDTRTGEGRILINSPGMTSPVAFTPDGRHVLVRQARTALELWSVDKGRRLETLVGGSNNSQCHGFTVGRSTAMLVASEWIPRPFANVLHAWDTTTWQRRRLFRTTDNYSFSGLALNPTASRLATAVGVIDVSTGHHLLKAMFPSYSLAWSPSAPIVAGSSYSREIRVHHTESGKLVTTLQLDRKQVQDFAFSPDGSCLVAVSNEERVRIWDTRSWLEKSGFAWVIGRLKCIAFAPDGMRAACAGHLGTIVIWDWE
jgi:WD40 repeat protein